MSGQSRKDAMADAETLRRMMNFGYQSALNYQWKVRIFGRLSSPRTARCDAINAAREAFRHVPGLRGQVALNLHDDAYAQGASGSSVCVD